MREERRFCLLLLFLSLAVLCESRVVKVPPGPLVRVEGQSVSIRCTVSDYQGPLEQEFEWSMIVNGKEVPLVSTFDQAFHDSSVADRVNSGDISIAKNGPAEAHLTIKKVRATDSTVYRCNTLSTDTVISGNYMDEVELQVIGDTMKVVPAIPQPSVSEGKSLELQCNVSRAYTAHTFLSVTFSVRKNASSVEEILTFGPDDELKVGQGFSQRYTDGGFLINLKGGGVYGVIIKGVKPQDQGTYVCMGREWTKQPGGLKGWQKILERSEEMGSVTVAPLAQSLVVSLEKNLKLNVADMLNLTCSVTADGLLNLGIEVMWVVQLTSSSAGERVLLHVGRDGQVLNGSELAGMSRVQPGTFRLLLNKVQSSDSGLYSCRVKCWLPQGSGGWYAVAEKTSDPVQVLVTQLEPEFNVSLTAPLTPQFTAAPTDLLCEVTDLLNLQDGRLGVTWFYTKNTAGGATTIASLNEHSVLVPGDVYRQRLEQGDIAVTHSSSNTFKLRLLHTQDEDMGLYSCSIAAWTPARQGKWNKAKEIKSAPVNVHWMSKTPVVKVVAQRVKEASSAGSTFEMTCQVSGQNLQNPGYSVLVNFEKQGVSRKVISLSADSVVQLEDKMEPGRAESVTLEKTGQLEYRFRLSKVQVSDQGFYYCTVTAWTRYGNSEWNKAASEQSEKIEIVFPDTGPAFNVSIQSDSPRVLPGESAKMECIMSVQGAVPSIGDVSYDIRWFQSTLQAMDNGDTMPLISLDRWGVVKKSGGNESTQCGLERTDRNKFVLSIYHARERDAGEYYCKAKPWYLSTANGQWSEGQELVSGRVFLAIKLQLWDSIKMPILYGIASALGVGVLSILVGFVTAKCCFSRNPMHTPRNKLIDLEMD